MSTITITLNTSVKDFEAKEELKGRRATWLKNPLPAFEPGRELTGRVIRTGVSQSELSVKLICYTSGRGAEDVYVDQALPTTRLDSNVELPFRFILPKGPYSFSGSLISVVWAVEAIESHTGEAARVEFILASQRQEVVATTVTEQIMTNIPTW